MTQGFDIDELERLLAAATPGEWVVTEGVEISAGNLGVIIECMYSENQESDEANAALIVTLKRSAHAILTEIRELRAENARLREALGGMLEYATFSERWQDRHPEYLAIARAALERIADE